ncbi:conserved hypothetical protein [Formosa agariphila KMM 3901]|uniref:Outer membrane protein beta-barrel domain-containing protein n=1 Tax=Formosa agariphila (strain DSM 15362 / KCTC 12365 / LMG 23005 / KMM 3901 / M-2Alg 35-1) TaxID=1347342 RepID=T2KSA0_FORAG|nr:DUF6646 family protein [Formosa agariphila]CDF81054.1 conserved hypothetical protein [Formosa agariphila KMM 3901]
MKNFLFIACLCVVSFANAQAFKGKGDQKFQIGASFQDNGTGITGTYDFGAGENISFGLASTYLLGVNDNLDANFEDRFDLKARFNANLSSVIGINEFDIYPGLNFSLKNFGAHVGARYFFSEGFGIYSEINFPIARYNTDNLSLEEELNNQFVFNIGASFNI